MTDRIRWGILGVGAIAHAFAEGLTHLPDAELKAVGSRSRSRAAEFGDAFGIPHRHGSYQELAADPDVDAIYIATRHTSHAACAGMCLRAGKAVLCEKPFTVNAREAEETIRTARETGMFLMEAMWTRFLPAIRRVRSWIREGAVGEIRMLRAAFGFRAETTVERLYRPEFGGGALLDVGVYPISLASMVFGGAPREIHGRAHIGPTGVDEHAAITLVHDGNAIADLACAIAVNMPQDAHIMGTEGTIRIHPPFWRPTEVTLTRRGEETHCSLALEGNGYTSEAAEVMRCLRAGECESPTMPLDETLAIMRTMDALRAQWNLTYPCETPPAEQTSQR